MTYVGLFWTQSSVGAPWNGRTTHKEKWYRLDDGRLLPESRIKELGLKVPEPVL
jgi:hypothetical protein